MRSKTCLSATLPWWPLVTLAGFQVAPLTSHAGSLEFVRQIGFVEISGDLRAFDIDNQKTTIATFSDSAFSHPGDLNPLRKGMDISMAEPSCFGQGVAYQSLVARPGSIHFVGTADVNVSGFASYPYMLEGSGGALVRVEYAFNVEQGQVIELSMDSGVGDFQDDEYKFSLKSLGGSYVWANTGVIGDDGGVMRKFKRQFTLEAGTYVVNAELAANSFLAGGNSVAGRTWAEFSISPVPEPHAAWMSLAGIFVLGAGFRKRTIDSR